MTDTFRCLVVRKSAAGAVSRGIEPLSIGDLPPGDVLIRVEWSSLNYKDALSATGHPGVTKSFPHVPGIDAAGTVVESSAERFRAGDKVLVTGFDFGAGRWGGYAELARVPADWLVALPAGLTARQSMIYGTAGFTAGMSLAALEHHEVRPSAGPILVTGASGGVGTMAVALLAKAGHDVEAATGKESARELLARLGAKRILTREEVSDTSPRPLLSPRWAGAIDTVGGGILATALRSVRPGGCVTACGLTAGTDLPTTVYPFILRGIQLIGIESSYYPMAKRIALWSKLAGPWKPNDLERIVSRTVGLDELEGPIQAILKGQVTGRVVVKL
ncbi:MAG TPA: oxidoreductase [Pirellulales bacterium]|jgi:putative YhdH/YhfP family quinone oxidoreductase|nr:oxidoreductase [Pirellulales bacterium]